MGSQYPNFTNPELRKAKQEELDTYGITNEQTRNKTIQKILYDHIIPRGYGSERGGILSPLSNFKKQRLPDTDVREDQFKMFLGYPMSYKNILRTHNISEFKPIGADQDYYYSLRRDAPIGIKSDRIKNLEEKLKNAHNMYINNPIKENLFKFSEMEKELKMRDISNIRSGWMLEGDSLIDKWGFQQDFDLGNSLTTGPESNTLGTYTIGKTNDYFSYFDSWDINPYKNSNIGLDKVDGIIENVSDAIINKHIGSPFSYYDRIYLNNKKPNIDELYKNFKWNK